MPQFIKIATRADLPEPGEAKEFTVGEKIICVANVDGTLSAMDNVCVHRGGPLGQAWSRTAKSSARGTDGNTIPKPACPTKILLSASPSIPSS